jgi:branched-chain amino acid:cation transporter, LIVCS family
MARPGWIQIFIIGIALFSMFFGGGNLTFPIWCGIQSESMFSTALGFLITGVALPFYGVLICLYFKGDYEKLLGVWGKPLEHLLVFSLLLFWIPLGSGPRCNQLAFGAYSQIGGTLPLWVHSAIYSVIVYLLTFRKRRILDILGNFITPVLLVSLISFVWMAIHNSQNDQGFKVNANWAEFLSGFSAGYYTMDFIAAVFFTSTIIALIKAKNKEQFRMSLASSSCIVALCLLSVVYIGMIYVGGVNADLLWNIPRDQILAGLGKAMFADKYHFIIFTVITLSCLTTSVALSLVYSNYIRITLFKEKIGHKGCLAISVLISYGFSVIGFESLAVLISYAMTTLYPFLLITTFASLVKKLYQKKYGVNAEIFNSKKCLQPMD